MSAPEWVLTADAEALRAAAAAVSERWAEEGRAGELERPGGPGPDYWEAVRAEMDAG